MRERAEESIEAVVLDTTDDRVLLLLRGDVAACGVSIGNVTVVVCVVSPSPPSLISLAAALRRTRLADADDGAGVACMDKLGIGDIMPAVVVVVVVVSTSAEITT